METALFMAGISGSHGGVRSKMMSTDLQHPGSSGDSANNKWGPIACKQMDHSSGEKPSTLQPIQESFPPVSSDIQLDKVTLAMNQSELGHIAMNQPELCNSAMNQLAKSNSLPVARYPIQHQMAPPNRDEYYKENVPAVMHPIQHQVTPPNRDEYNKENVSVRNGSHQQSVFPQSQFDHQTGRSPVNGLYANPHHSVDYNSYIQSSHSQSNRGSGFQSQESLHGDYQTVQRNLGYAPMNMGHGQHPSGMYPQETYRHPNMGYSDGSHMNPVRSSQLTYPQGQHKFQPEPRSRLPEYSGKSEWRAFYMQFQLIVQQYGWDENTQLQKLILCLQGPVLDFVSRLPAITRQRMATLICALDHRFGDHTLPETHRASLQNIRKKSSESLREYDARVKRLMSQAYPGMEGTEMFNTMAVEYLLTGLPDPNMSFDILSKKPRTLEEALNHIEWYECCKNTNKRRNGVRQVTLKDYESADEAEPDIRRVGGRRFVTEERLHQMGMELQEKMLKAQEKFFEKINFGMGPKPAVKTELKNTTVKQSSRETEPNWMQGDHKKDDRRKSDKCFRCDKPGHFARECPTREQGKHRIREICESDPEEDYTSSEEN